MAYVKILNINCNSSYLQAAVKYAVQPDKTIFERLQVANVYASDLNKTELDEVRYATCINLSGLDTAAEEMMETKVLWNKTSGRLGYHIIQSFSPDDKVTPELAHEIGVAYAKELFGDFEVVVGTHVDRAHVHNHIVINSVSCVDGRKAHMEKGYLHNTLRSVSDRLCKEHGLPVIAYTKESEMSKAHWAQRHWRQGSFKESINADIRRACAASQSVAEMFVRLENMGYTVDSSRKHTTITPPDGTKPWRISRFYTAEELEHMTTGEGLRPLLLPKQLRIKTPFVREDPRKLTLFEYSYLRWMRLLGEGRKGARTSVPVAELRKYNQSLQQLRFLAKHKLHKLSEVISYRQGLEIQYRQLNRTRYALQGKKRKYEGLYSAVRRLSQLQQIDSAHWSEEMAASWEEAQATVNGSGYTPARIEELRIALQADILANRAKINAVQQEIQICKGIEEKTPIIHTALRKERTVQRMQNRAETDKTDGKNFVPNWDKVPSR